MSVGVCLSVCSLNRFRCSCFEEHSNLFLAFFFVHSFFLDFFELRRDYSGAKSGCGRALRNLGVGGGDR